MKAIADLLLDRTAELVDISSVSHHEHAIADHVEAQLGRIAALQVSRIGDNVVARTETGSADRLLLGGHLDTVPPAGNATARLVGGRCHGCGSADMKGGLAILLQLAQEATAAGPDLTVVFYAREEVAREHSGLLEIERAAPELLRTDVAVLLEPTDGVVEAGCQGVLRVNLTVAGVAAHSARPWTGRNAIHRLAPVLARVGELGERRPTIEGCEFHESVQAVRVEGGTAANVLPVAANLRLSYRFAPDRTVEQAFEWLSSELRGVLDPQLGDTLALSESAPAAPPALEHPALRTLVELSAKKVRAKLAWTDVAFFAERSVAAANFGPGDPLVAHSAAENISGEALERTYRALAMLTTQSW